MIHALLDRPQSQNQVLACGPRLPRISAAGDHADQEFLSNLSFLFTRTVAGLDREKCTTFGIRILILILQNGAAGEEMVFERGYATISPVLSSDLTS